MKKRHDDVHQQHKEEAEMSPSSMETGIPGSTLTADEQSQMQDIKHASQERAANQSGHLPPDDEASLDMDASKVVPTTGPVRVNLKQEVTLNGVKYGPGVDVVVPAEAHEVWKHAVDWTNPKKAIQHVHKHQREAWDKKEAEKKKVPSPTLDMKPTEVKPA